MKDRLVKGTSVVGVVRLLRSQLRTRQMPELGPWEQDLLRKRVAPSTWYALGVFDSLLQYAHRYVFDGSEAAAQNMGRVFARELNASRSSAAYIGDGPRQAEAPLERFANLGARWRKLYNFGEFNVTPWPTADSQQGAKVQISGYPDMSACHGHAIIGWSLQLVEDAGAKDVVLRVEERPWMHNSVLTYTLSWS
jgi:hypothetical protein